MYEFRPFRASLTLTLSQGERELILLSFFPQGLRPGLYSCRAVGAQKQHCKPVNSYALRMFCIRVNSYIHFYSACIIPDKAA